jgi:serine protease Do
LFDLNGDVIGINTAVVLPNKQTNGIGFAIPADDDVTRLVRDLKDGREVAHGYLGVTVAQPTPADPRDGRLTTETGCAG